ncbi:MAG: BrnA antitoxin family protein [Magnetococcales bacterium]|nr:BrnA antitoxin family protein [Magnetococcales bacterium]
MKSKADKEIAQAVASDPDTFMPDRAWFERAQLVTPKSNEMITLRLDQDVLTWFRSAGSGYQARINSALKAFITYTNKETL